MKYKFRFLIFMATAVLLISCQKDNSNPDEPIFPQGEVTREFLSQIRVGKDGWVPVSMRYEWLTIYGPQVKRN